MDATNEALLQVSITDRQHLILKTIALESKSTVSDLIRPAVAKLVASKHGKSISERLDARNG